MRICQEIIEKLSLLAITLNLTKWSSMHGCADMLLIIWISLLMCADRLLTNWPSILMCADRLLKNWPSNWIFRNDISMFFSCNHNYWSILWPWVAPYMPRQAKLCCIGFITLFTFLDVFPCVDIGFSSALFHCIPCKCQTDWIACAL